MKLPAKLALGGMAALLAVGVSATVAVLLLVDADSLRPQVQERLSGMLGRTVSVGRVSLSFWGGPGAKLDGMEVGEPPAMERSTVPTLTAPRARVRLALVPLLGGKIVVRSLALDDGVMRVGEQVLLEQVFLKARLGTPADGAVHSRGLLQARVSVLPGEPRGEVRFAVSLRDDRLVVGTSAVRVGVASFQVSGDATGMRSSSPRVALEIDGRVGSTMVDGTIVLALVRGQPDLRFDLKSPSLDLDHWLDRIGRGGRVESRGRAVARDWLPASLADTGVAHRSGAAWLGQARAEGSLIADRAVALGVELRHLVTHLGVEGERLSLKRVGFELYGGQHQGEFSATLQEGGVFRLDSKFTGVNVEPIVAALAPDHAGTLHGTGDLALVLSGTGSGGGLDPASLSGTARLEIRDGRLVSMGMLQQAVSLLTKAEGSGTGREDTAFQALSATLQIASSEATTTDLAVRAQDMDLTGAGRVGFDGALGLDLVLSLSREASAPMIERTPRLRLWTRGDGRLAVPVQIRGTLSSPQVRIDVDRIVAEGFGRLLEEKRRQGLLRGILGGR